MNTGSQVTFRDTILYPQDGMFHFNSAVRVVEVTDGTSNTLLFGEAYHRDPRFLFLYPASRPFNSDFEYWACWYWGYGGTWRSAGMDINANLPVTFSAHGSHTTTRSNARLQRLSTYGSGHPGGANFAMADGSVVFIRQTIMPDTLVALSTRAAGDQPAEDWR